MKKTKTVKRKWFNKTTQEWITREYVYETVREGKRVTTKSRKKSKLIVGKNGVYKDRLNALLETTDDLSVKADIKAKVNEAVRKGEKLSTKTLMSKVADSRIEKMFINAGYTEPEILNELGISRDDLFNEDNWDGSTFSIAGLTYKFVFDPQYTGNVLMLQE